MRIIVVGKHTQIEINRIPAIRCAFFPVLVKQLVSSVHSFSHQDHFKFVSLLLDEILLELMRLNYSIVEKLLFDDLLVDYGLAEPKAVHKANKMTLIYKVAFSDFAHTSHGPLSYFFVFNNFFKAKNLIFTKNNQWNCLYCSSNKSWLCKLHCFFFFSAIDSAINLL